MESESVVDYCWHLESIHSDYTHQVQCWRRAIVNQLVGLPMSPVRLQYLLRGVSVLELLWSRRKLEWIGLVAVDDAKAREVISDQRLYIHEAVEKNQHFRLACLSNIKIVQVNIYKTGLNLTSTFTYYCFQWIFIFA